MKLLGKNVLLAEVEKDVKTAGGIILTGETSKAVKPGLVLAIGDLVVDIPVGSRVYVAWDGAMPIDYKGDRACIVTADKIKAVLGDDGE
jgi:co-chaperonin GroES (HSP10)